jgi:sugar (pentulose or hexulose) kinase
VRIAIDGHAWNEQSARKTGRSMSYVQPRGIAVVDVGYTNTKIALFAPDGHLVAERKSPSRHVEGSLYRQIDPAPMLELCRTALPELDKFLPIDAIVPCAHGAALACLDSSGRLALPVMDYTSEPPTAIVESYKKIMPGFDEAFCPLLPMALTHGLQLYWQEQAMPEEFGAVATVIPWIQYVGFALSGEAVTEISSMSCQTHLMDTRTQTLSSLVKSRGWEKLFPRMAKAWETIGELKPNFKTEGFRGEGRVLGGVHDSTANFMRYLCAGLDRFTLVSTGTWSISFDRSTPLEILDPERDTNTNTDVLGRTVCCSRFFGGKEFEAVANGAAADLATLPCIEALMARGTKAIPSYTLSSGPVPNSGGRGRIIGPVPQSAEERASLAALYCAQMVSEQLDAIASRDDIIIDGPMSQNPVLLAVLGQLRPRQNVMASDLRDGTTAGAAALALIENGNLPNIGLKLIATQPSSIEGLQSYHAKWKERAYEV